MSAPNPEPHLATIRALARALDAAEAELAAARRDAAEARDIFAQTLYLVTGGQGGEWTIGAAQRFEAAEHVAALEWEPGPAGNVIVALELKEPNQ